MMLVGSEQPTPHALPPPSFPILEVGGGEIPRMTFDDPRALELLRARRPVVLTGTGLVGTGVERWTLAYLRAHINPASKFDVYESEGAFQYSDPENTSSGYAYERKVTKRSTTFAAFCDLLPADLPQEEGSPGSDGGGGGSGGGNGGGGGGALKAVAEEAAVADGHGDGRHDDGGSVEEKSKDRAEQQETVAPVSTVAEAGRVEELDRLIAENGRKKEEEMVRHGEELRRLSEELRKLEAERAAKAAKAALDVKKADGEDAAATTATATATAADSGAAETSGGGQRRHRRKRAYLQQGLFMGIGDQVTRDFQGFKWDWLNALTKLLRFGPQTSNLLLIGEDGCVTPCHYDEQENLFAQVQGHKRCVLFSPEHYNKLYPHPMFHPADRQCQPDMYAPCPDRYPRVPEALAHGVETILAPGDVLYIPEYWFHHIEAPFGTNTSVNFWFKAASPDPKAPPAIPIVLPGKLIALSRNLERLTKQQMEDNGHASSEFFKALGEYHSFHRLRREAGVGGGGADGKEGDEGNEGKEGKEGGDLLEGSRLLTPSQDAMRRQLTKLVQVVLSAEHVSSFIEDFVANRYSHLPRVAGWNQEDVLNVGAKLIPM